MCVHSHDMDHDDGGYGSEYSLCVRGTDCGDCGSRLADEEGPPRSRPTRSSGTAPKAAHRRAAEARMIGAVVGVPARRRRRRAPADALRARRRQRRGGGGADALTELFLLWQPARRQEADAVNNTLLLNFNHSTRNTGAALWCWEGDVVEMPALHGPRVGQFLGGAAVRAERVELGQGTQSPILKRCAAGWPSG